MNVKCRRNCFYFFLLLPNLSELSELQAAQRRAIGELLFFASVGDLRRCERLVKLWGLKVPKARYCRPTFADINKYMLEVCSHVVPDCPVFTLQNRCQIPIAAIMTGEHHCESLDLA